MLESNTFLYSASARWTLLDFKAASASLSSVVDADGDAIMQNYEVLEG